MADTANATGLCHQAEGDDQREGVQLLEDKKAGFKHMCKWSNCSNRGPFSRAEELTQHLETEHFPTFDSEEFVMCLWEGCKVFNRPCNKKSWLSNHVKLHTKERPNKCLFNGCSMSFCSVEALQNHLQKHFQTTKSIKAFKGLKQKGRSRDWRLQSSLGSNRNSPGSSPGEGEDDNSPECSKKTEKKRLSLRVRIPLHSSVSLSTPQSGNPQPVPVNGAHIHSDLIDRKTMAVVKDTVSHLVRYSPSWSCDGICLHAEIIGKRLPAATATEEYLVRWSPRLLADSWIPVHDFQHQKILFLSDLTPTQKSAITSMFFYSENSGRHSRKRKRNDTSI